MMPPEPSVTRRGDALIFRNADHLTQVQVYELLEVELEQLGRIDLILTVCPYGIAPVKAVFTVGNLELAHALLDQVADLIGTP